MAHHRVIDMISSLRRSIVLILLNMFYVINSMASDEEGEVDFFLRKIPGMNFVGDN